jgi:hypothetical protein
MAVGKVTKHALGPDGTVAGTYDENPCLNTMIHEVEFPNGQLKEHAANVIAENMLTQVDSDGHSLTMMEAITDCRKDEAVAVPKINKHLTTTSGQKRLGKTAVGAMVAAGEVGRWVRVLDSIERSEGVTPN